MSKHKRKSGKTQHSGKGKKLIRTLLKAAVISTAIGITAFLIFVQLVKSGSFGPIPSEQDLANIKNNLATEIYSEEGKLLGRYFLQQRTPTTYDQISPDVIDALVATEDARFYNHDGVDYRSLVRVLIKTVILQDRSGGGGSTISQQLAKNLFPRESMSGFMDILVTKVKESIIAQRLERNYSKKDILTLYLNTVPFGENIYGIEMAANRFFSKSASELEPQEAAVLIGMLKANYTFNPRVFPEKSLGRRNVVLGQLKKYGYIDDNEYKRLIELPLELDYKNLTVGGGNADYFKEQLRDKVEAWCAANKKPDGTNYNLLTDGLKIYTTINSSLQNAAEAAMQKHMAALQKQFYQHWGNQQPWRDSPQILDRAIQTSNRYQNLKKQGLSHQAILEKMKEKHPMELFSWNGPEVKNVSPIDSIAHYLKILHAGVVGLEPNTGAVKAWIGGIDFNYFKYDHAREQTKRQVGSTFKPLVYAAALEKGLAPCEYISARRTTYTNLANWSPNNADEKENELKYSFEGALTHSVNTVSIKVLEQIGLNGPIELAENLGIHSTLPEVPSLALGTADISLIEMATAYAAFANGGKKVNPYFITKIEDHQGKVLYEAPKPELEQALQPSTAQLINHMLQSVVNSGTAGRIRWKYGLSNELAGKTGTTQNNADGWFIGYNPKLVLAVWVGADNPGIRFRSTALGSGANMALPIFAETFKTINATRELQAIAKARFEKLPEHLENLLDCEPSKEDRNFFERLLNKDLTKGEKVRKFDSKEEEAEGEEEKKGFFKKIGDIFKKKKDKGGE